VGCGTCWCCASYCGWVLSCSLIHSRLLHYHAGRLPDLGRPDAMTGRMWPCSGNQPIKQLPITSDISVCIRAQSEGADDPIPSAAARWQSALAERQNRSKVTAKLQILSSLALEGYSAAAKGRADTPVGPQSGMRVLTADPADETRVHRRSDFICMPGAPARAASPRSFRSSGA